MTEIDFPVLARAYEALCLDQGMPTWDMDADLSLAAISYLFQPEEMQAAERELATLTPEQFETLLTGDEDDWPPIHANTQRVIDALFEEI